MATGASRPVADRILGLLQHLGLERVHVAGAMPGDWRGLATTAADRVSSLSLVCPTAVDATALAAIASRVLIFHGDQGPAVERVRSAVARVPGATLETLTNYPGLRFADIGAERRDDIEPALLAFLGRMERQAPSAGILCAPGLGRSMASRTTSWALGRRWCSCR